MSKDGNKTPAAAAWKPPADWRPYTRGFPGRGRVMQRGDDGKAYSRPRTAEEDAALAQGIVRKPGAGPVARFAAGVREHMETREKFLAVMDEASFSDKAAQNLIDWLTEWRSNAAKRQIESKQAALQKLQFEIAALRTVTKAG